MTPCRTCHLPWDHMNSHFTVCPSCRAKLLARRRRTLNPIRANRKFTPIK